MGERSFEMIGLMGVKNNGRTLVAPNGKELFSVPLAHSEDSTLDCTKDVGVNKGYLKT